jgi:YD repeat-containing protein
LKELNETRLTDSLGSVWIVKFDEHGLPISEIDPLGGIAQYEYDEVGRTTAVVDPDGHPPGTNTTSAATCSNSPGRMGTRSSARSILRTKRRASPIRTVRFGGRNGTGAGCWRGRSALSGPCPATSTMTGANSSPL